MFSQAGMGSKGSCVHTNQLEKVDSSALNVKSTELNTMAYTTMPILCMTVQCSEVKFKCGTE